MRLRILALLPLAITATIAQNANAQSLIGITQDDKVFTMTSVSAPGTVSTPIAITGMTAGQTVAGADYRIKNGELYILGYNGTNNNAQIYKLNPATGVATAVSTTPMTLALGSNASIGFDFNPTVDRIRIVGANKKSFRIDPTTATVAATDADLSFAGTDVNAAAIATIGAVAYSNSYQGASTTTLYNYDQLLNVLTIQNPPNSGTLNTVGSSGLAVNALTHSIDMDIYMDPVTVSNMAYLAANTGAAVNDNLYTVNLTTGTATNVGQIGGGLDVKNIAIPVKQTLPAVTGKMIYAIQANTSTMLSFDSDNPKLLHSYMPITGITTGQNVVGLDFRPANSELYALGYNNLATNYQLYTINTTTGAATAVNTAPITLDLGLTTNVAFDFNPMVDRIRVISRSTGVNYRLNPTDGSIAATDGAVNYLAADVNFGSTPHIGAVAYTNSYMGATSTELYALDDSLGALIKIASPNSGSLTTNTSSFYSVNLADITSDVDFFYDSTTSTDIGFMSANTLTATNDNLYKFSLGAPTSMTSNLIGLGIPVSDIAVQPQYKATGIRNVNAQKKSFAVYPNPATDELYINATGVANNNAIIDITDVTGRLVKTTTVSNGKITIADLQQGIYFVKLVVDGEVYQTQKVVKQ